MTTRGWAVIVFLLLSSFISDVWAQTPSPVTPGYQVCSNASGVTKCTFQPVGTDNVLGNQGLPVGAMVVSTCGSQSFTAGAPVMMTMDTTGKLCDGSSGSVAATVQGAANITLTDCSGAITSGGTAQNAFTAAATRHGFTIANIDTSEVLWISFTTTALASGTGSYPLGPATATTFANLSSFTSPIGMGINTALSVVAATTTHKFTCTTW